MAEITGSLKHGPASEEQISALESQIGATLPEDYKAFLRTHNGGRPAPDAFSFINDLDEEEEDIVECFFPVRTVDCSTMEDMTIDDLPDWPVQCAWEDLQRDVRELDECELDNQILPIGTDGSGNYIAIVLDGEHSGSIVFFEHAMGRVSYLAASFSAFLNGLRERQRDGSPPGMLRLRLVLL
jgi:cell wall assembly regulator SMI1